MIARCPKCAKYYEKADSALAADFYCSCGEKLVLDSEQVFSQLEQICKDYALKIEEENISHIRKTADRIVSLIFNDASSKLDIDIEKQKLRQLIEQISPERVDLYELIYEPRFNRLWEQFRENPELK
jgi:hypothetical protein